MGGLDCRIGKSYGEQLQGHLLRETGVGGLLRFGVCLAKSIIPIRKGIAFFLSALMILFITSNSAHAGTVELPQTGQTKCYDSAGTEITCSGTGQDGNIRAGVPWPVPRFTDNGDGTVTDNLTGLIWTKDGGTPTVGSCTGGTRTWQGALDYVACLNSAGYLGSTDWRLPNVNELESLINADEPNTDTWLNTQGFSNVQSGIYWSSTTGAGSTGYAWVVDMRVGYVGNYYKAGNYYVWPVRSGQ